MPGSLLPFIPLIFHEWQKKNNFSPQVSRAPYELLQKQEDSSPSESLSDCLFFEGIGILLQRKLLDIKMVEDLFGGSVTRA